MLRETISLAPARARLHDLRHRRNDAFGCAAILGAGSAAAVALAMPPLAAVLACGVLMACLIAALSGWQRRDLLTQLVAQGDATALPAVERHAQELVGPRRRLELARGIERVARPGGVAPRRRVTLAEPALREIAARLRDGDQPVQPAAVALTHTMLVHGATSPLLNDAIGEAELHRLLRTIQAGVKAA